MTSAPYFSIVGFFLALNLAPARALAVCGDVTGDGNISASDALKVLNAGIGGAVDLTCSCDDCFETTTTLPPTTTTTTLRISRTLQVSRKGAGTGSVTSNPSGINCGSDCKESYSDGTAVSLTAHPGVDSDFDGWSGDVPSSCVGSNGPCSVSMNKNRNVVATFVPAAGSTYIRYQNRLVCGGLYTTFTLRSEDTGIEWSANTDEFSPYEQHPLRLLGRFVLSNARTCPDIVFDIDPLHELAEECSPSCGGAYCQDGDGATYKLRVEILGQEVPPPEQGTWLVLYEETDSGSPYGCERARWKAVQ